MASLVKLVEMLQRTKNGQNCTVKEWEQQVIPTKVRAILKKYDLEKKYNPETPVNQDLDLADRFFTAGLELASNIGVLCTDTEVVIDITREEIMEAIEKATPELLLGEGSDEIVLHSRKPQDERSPRYASSVAIVIDEGLYVPLVEGITRCRDVHILQGPSIDTVFGAPVYGGSPFETVAGLLENRLRAEALWRSGRSGMPSMSISSATTEFGQLGGFPGQTKPSNRSIAFCLQPAEFKTNYSNFHKIASAIGYDGYIRSGCPTMIGGYSGSAEGAAVANIATHLHQFVINQANISASSVFDIRLDSSCGRHGLWVLSVISQAISRNTHLLFESIINQTAGPCTEEILYTCAAGLITTGVSGMSLTTGPRSAGGSYRNYISPLEAWWCAKVYKATGGMTLDKANELVLYLLSKYEKTIKNQPKGKSFPECFDINTLTPTMEWQEIYDRVKKDMITRGLNIV